MSLPAKIKLKYTIQSDGSIILSTAAAPGAIKIWQFCPAESLDWVQVGPEGADTFRISASALKRFGEKYRCIGYVNDRPEYYSDAVTMSRSLLDEAAAFINDQNAEEENAGGDGGKEGSWYERWQKHEEEQKRWEESRKYRQEDTYQRDRTYEDQQRRWREEEQRQRERWREEQARWDQNHRPQSASGEFDFFKGCADWEAIESRYRRLMQAYHPDHKGGDEETTKILVEQYNKLKQRYGK